MTLRDRSWRGSRFYRTPRGVRNKGFNHSKNVISTCNRTVFKLRSSNFTVTSMTPRDRSWRGSRFYRTPRGVRNKGLITQKNVISTCNRTVFKIRSSNFTGTSMTPRDRSWRGSRFLPYPQRGQKYRVNHSKT